jgi:hypothetical protein
VIVSLAFGILVQSIFDPHGADWEQVSRDGVGVLLEGLRKGQGMAEKSNFFGLERGSS